MESACTSLTPIAEHYAHTGIMLCLEPNPEQYGCDFVTRGADAAMLVRAVDSDGLRLHLDTACAALAGESAGHLARENRDILAHFHASEPMLAGFDNPGSQHAVAAAALREIGYKGWVAVEMRKQDDPLGSLQAAVSFATKTYGDGAN
jgi:sugar phosphate isomerase/epimerase